MVYYFIFYSHFPLPRGGPGKTQPIIPTPERRNNMKKQILAALALLLFLLSACHRGELQKQQEPPQEDSPQLEENPQEQDNGITVTEDVSSGEENAQDGTFLFPPPRCSIRGSS